MEWFFVAIGVLLVLTIVGWTLAFRESSSFGIIVSFLASLALVVMIIWTSVLLWNHSASGARADLLNRSFGTHYTPDDIFYGDDIVRQVIQGYRSRIDITTEQK